ncbi:MAG: hypothetical protein DI551_06985 [Micavibrio aeruginosavorus]|uniref:DUF3299 domain-containing protein n=1 Tax=Micavibrio aeruginosavorus TaxID=349221 RepID=A0A2W5Q2J5_9BACT|nr:MAG: hypothetical protein DI551_06985 [Micavibrio aeruginosavorus]
MIRILLFCLCFVFSSQAHALTLEEGSDAPTRSIEDYIKDYVDIPKGGIDWKQFGKTKQISIDVKDKDGLENQYYKPDFPAELKALDGKEVIIKGFMFPLDETEDQKLFLFGPFPLNCPFQYHVQSNLVIEVHADKKPVPFTYDPVTLQGTLELVPEDKENSTFYRLKDAEEIK